MRLNLHFPGCVSLFRMAFFFSINGMKPLIFVMEVQYVFCAVGSQFVNIIYLNLGFRRVDVAGASHFIIMHLNIPSVSV